MQKKCKIKVRCFFGVCKPKNMFMKRWIKVCVCVCQLMDICMYKYKYMGVKYVKLIIIINTHVYRMVKRR